MSGLPGHRKMRPGPVGHVKGGGTGRRDRDKAVRGEVYSVEAKTQFPTGARRATWLEQRCLPALMIRHQAGARWPATFRWMGSFIQLLEPSRS